MLFSTPTQFAVLALCLVAGWLFGLASHPGGGKWKARYLAERDAHAANRKAAETQIAEARRGTSADLASAQKHIAELERENARLARVAPVTHATVTRQQSSRAAYPAGERRGWFDWNARS